jgi:hypothetical protein
MLIKDDSIKQWYEGSYVNGGTGRDYVGMFFGMNMGTAINAYRLNFLEYLKGLGDEGETRWREFVTDLAKKEKKTESFEQVEHLFPLTLDDALEYYQGGPSVNIEDMKYESRP